MHVLHYDVMQMRNVNHENGFLYDIVRQYANERQFVHNKRVQNIKKTSQEVQ